MTTVFSEFLGSILALFQITLDVYGFSFSFWDIFIFTLFVGIVLKFIGGLLDL